MIKVHMPAANAALETILGEDPAKKTTLGNILLNHKKNSGIKSHPDQLEETTPKSFTYVHLIPFI